MSSNRLRKTAAAAGLAGAVGVGWMWWTSSQNDAPVGLPRPALQPVPKAEATSPQATPKASISEQFAEGSPLAGYVEVLVASAAAGDSGSACRLGYELARCKLWLEAKESVAGSRKKVLDLPFDQSVKRKLLADVEAPLQKHAEASRICAGVEAALIHRSFDYMAQAAKAGDVRSMVRIAYTPPLQQVVSHRESAAWSIYRSESHKWLSAALDAGDASAYWIALLVSSGKVSSSIVPSFPRDASRAIVYGTAIKNALDSERAGRAENLLKALSKSVGPEMAARATEEGVELRKSKLSAVKASGVDEAASSGCR